MTNIELLIKTWPTEDQALWSKATMAPNTVFDKAGLAADWRPATIRLRVEAYNGLLSWLRANDMLAEDVPPEQRFDRSLLRKYVQFLRSRKYSDWTIYTHLHHLCYMLRALTKRKHPKWLARAANKIASQAQLASPKAPRIVHSARLYDLGIERMAPIRAAGSLTRNGAVQFRDGLSIAMRALCPLRSSEHLTLRIGSNFRLEGKRYVARLGPDETKSKHPAEAYYSVSLTPWINHYVNVIRPFLARGKPVGDQLWIAHGGKPIIKDAHRISRLTTKKFNRRINPHLFRDCAVTTVANDAPEKIGVMPAVLNHSTARTGEAFYNQACMLSAARRHRAVILKFQEQKQ